MDPRPQRELQDEHLARLGEEHGRLRGDHPHVLVALHDLLDPSQRQLVVLKVAPRLDLLHLLLPEQTELLLVLLREVVRLHVVRRELLLLQMLAHELLLVLRLAGGIHAPHAGHLTGRHAGLTGHAVPLLVHHARRLLALVAAGSARA